MIARLAVVAALVGSAAGATAVLAADDEPRPVVPAVKTPVASPHPTPEPLEARAPKIVLKQPDPKGAAAWAVRSFETTFTSRKGNKTPASCYEVGRLQDGTFGWIGSDGAFTPTTPGRAQNPIDCPSPGVLKAIEATIYRFATVTTPPAGWPQPDQAVTWGVAEPQITTITLPGEPPIATRGSVFLQVASGSVPAAPLKRTLERADGTRRTIDELGDFRGEQSVPGSGELAAIAPDPAGGRPWGFIVMRGERGSTCATAPEQLVGDAYAHVDDTLGVAFSTALSSLGGCRRERPTRAFPMRLDTLVSGTDPDSDSGRIERRILDGRIVFFGTVHPDVVSVTISTPHDVRTLLPTPKHHAILAVYAGRFPGGEATATARLKDGRSFTRRLHVE